LGETVYVIGIRGDRRPCWNKVVNIRSINGSMLIIIIIIIISSGFAKASPIRSLEAPYKLKYRLNSTTNR